MKPLNSVEISRSALAHNVGEFRRIVGPDVKLAPAVKANAYGHGLLECAHVFAEAGADYLCVNAAFEAEKLRGAGLKIPILIIGYTPLHDLKTAVELGAELLVYNLETLEALVKLGKTVSVHLKIETGNHRQGVTRSELPSFIEFFKRHPHIQLKGLSTHFANIEDTEHQEYAREQLAEFNAAIRDLENAGLNPPLRHCSNTAATIVLPEARFNMVRTGIGNYGLWPSDETERSAKMAGIRLEFKPALTWKTTVAQIKEVKQGAKIGYGCTYEMPRDGRIAIIPVGYYDGYVRALSNKGAVLIRGQRAPVIGRVCMNIIMVDVSHLTDIDLEDEVVLIGSQGSETITAEDVAEWSNTINYEVTTRINEAIPRALI